MSTPSHNTKKEVRFNLTPEVHTVSVDKQETKPGLLNRLASQLNNGLISPAVNAINSVIIPAKEVIKKTVEPVQKAIGKAIEPTKAVAIRIADLGKSTFQKTLDTFKQQAAEKTDEFISEVKEKANEAAQDVVRETAKTAENEIDQIVKHTADEAKVKIDEVKKHALSFLPNMSSNSESIVNKLPAAADKLKQSLHELNCDNNKQPELKQSSNGLTGFFQKIGNFFNTYFIQPIKAFFKMITMLPKLTKFISSITSIFNSLFSSNNDKHDTKSLDTQLLSPVTGKTMYATESTNQPIETTKSGNSVSTEPRAEITNKAKI